MPPPPDLLDEITSLNSIYADDTLTLLTSNLNDKSWICTLTPPSSAIHPLVKLTIRFHDSYPSSSPPEILNGTTHGKGLSSDDVTALARDVLRGVWMEGGVVMFELVEGLKEVLHIEPSPEHASPSTIAEEAAIDEHDYEVRTAADLDKHVAPTISSTPWKVTPPTIVSKSVFVARAVHVTSAEQAKGYIADLIATDRKVGKATHNITAYRIRTANGVIFQDNDDDGETAAGSRLAHLLELIGVWGVLVIVSRWYGGVKLGPDRFRIINTVAREALSMGGFVGDEKSGKGEKKGRK